MKKSTDSLSGRNPLTIDDVDTLATDFARMTLDAKSGGDLLLLFHAFTYEPSMATREGMLQTIKEAFAFVFPAFDVMMREEIRGRLDALKGGVR